MRIKKNLCSRPKVDAVLGKVDPVLFDVLFKGSIAQIKFKILVHDGFNLFRFHYNMAYCKTQYAIQSGSVLRDDLFLSFFFLHRPHRVLDAPGGGDQGFVVHAAAQA